MSPLTAVFGCVVSQSQPFEITDLEEAEIHITMAALSYGDSPLPSTAISVLMKVDDETFTLCNLRPGSLDQQRLDIVVNGDQEITFLVKGEAEVHLTGNLVFPDLDEDMFGGDSGSEEDDEEEEEENEEEEEEEEAPKLVPVSKKEQSVQKEQIAQKVENTKKHALNDGKADKAQNVKKAKNEAPVESSSKEEPKKRTVSGGLVIEDLNVGTGKKATNGNRVQMRYTGKLTNGKVFDSNTKGAPFTFKLGKGEVIKGWDLGIQGMQVGGRRRLTIPAALGYGKKGAPPDIPPNATLVFEVQLVQIK